MFFLKLTDGLRITWNVRKYLSIIFTMNVIKVYLRLYIRNVYNYKLK